MAIQGSTSSPTASPLSTSSETKKNIEEYDEALSSEGEQEPKGRRKGKRKGEKKFSQRIKQHFKKLFTPEKKALIAASIAGSLGGISGAIRKFKKEGLGFKSAHDNAKEITIDKDQKLLDNPEVLKIANPEGRTSHSQIADIAKLSYTSYEDMQLLDEKSDMDGFDNKLEEKIYKDLKKNIKKYPSLRVKYKGLKGKELKKALKEKAKDDAEFVKTFKEENQNIKFAQDIYNDPNHTEANYDKAAKALLKKAEHSDTGLQLSVLENSETNEVVIAFRGTDELKDWKTNTQLGKNQIKEIEAELKAYVEELSKEEPPKSITFTGQSLGGGLAEIAAYKAQKNSPQADISLVSFNGFGGAEGVGEDIDQAILDQLESTNYRIGNDPVSPIGTHLTEHNIKINTHERNPLIAHSMDSIRLAFAGESPPAPKNKGLLGGLRAHLGNILNMHTQEHNTPQLSEKNISKVKADLEAQ